MLEICIIINVFYFIFIKMLKGWVAEYFHESPYIEQNVILLQSCYPRFLYRISVLDISDHWVRVNRHSILSTQSHNSDALEYNRRRRFTLERLARLISVRPINQDLNIWQWDSNPINHKKTISKISSHRQIIMKWSYLLQLDKYCIFYQISW